MFTARDLSPATTPTMYFVGVTTAQSAIMRIYPRWADVLGFPTELRGLDFPLDAPAAEYRAAVEHIKRDPLSLGALVTSHKLNLFRASSDLFDDLGESAHLLSEVSSISKRGPVLWGRALDDVTSGLALKALLPPDHWERSKGEMLLLGAGGASIAATLHLHRCKARGEATPRRIHVCEVDESRLAHMRDLHTALGVMIPFTYHHCASPEMSDAVVNGLPPASLVVNATGLGKDRPGSPLTDAALFPFNSIAWDLNYRGDLPFLEQARAQSRDRGVVASDGWDYFIYSWTQVIADVHDLRIPTSGALYDQLSGIATAVAR